MQFWPRKRARRSYAKVHAWPESRDVKLLGFAGYKVGMCHAMIVDNRKTAMTKGEEISIPLTVIECPPLKIYGVRFYKKVLGGEAVIADVVTKGDKELGRKIPLTKNVKKKPEDVDLKQVTRIHALVHTQPKLTGIGKKKPEIFEVAIGGKVEEQFAFIKDKLGKEVPINEVFSSGLLLDTHAVTKGKGYQGPVKRFGVTIRQHKSEKTKRGPGSLGAWNAQGRITYRVAHAGQMGYHLRTEYNKWLIKIEEGKNLTHPAGFKHYGVLKNPCMLLKGSVPGAYKRLIRFNPAMRPTKNVPKEAPQIQQLVLI